MGPRFRPLAGREVRNLCSWPSLLKRFREPAERLGLGCRSHRRSLQKKKKKEKKRKERKGRKKKEKKRKKSPWQFSLRSTAAFPQQLTGQMVRKQLRRTKPPAVPHGQPGSPAPGAVRRGREKGFRSRPPFLKEDKTLRGKVWKTGRRASAGKWAALGRRRSDKPPGFGSKDQTRAKECTECGGRR